MVAVWPCDPGIGRRGLRNNSPAASLFQAFPDDSGHYGRYGLHGWVPGGFLVVSAQFGKDWWLISPPATSGRRKLQNCSFVPDVLKVVMFSHPPFWFFDLVPQVSKVAFQTLKFQKLLKTVLVDLFLF